MVNVVAMMALAVRDSVRNHDWWLVFPAYVTLAFLCWQSWETRRSAEAAEKSAEAALLNAKAVIDAERAWILAELSFDPHQSLAIGWGVSTGDDGFESSSTSVRLKLTCKNDGKGPAWIDGIYGRMDIASTQAGFHNHEKQDCENLGLLEPIAAASEKSRSLDLSANGILGRDQLLSVFLIIEYRDAFGQARRTTLDYNVSHNRQLSRRTEHINRNTNT